jgi:sulfhydrogenase subunit beta (sulfur reductase)
MGKDNLRVKDELIFDQEGLQQLLIVLKKKGYTTLGPRMSGRVIIYDELKSISDLPVGWHDIQAAGRYLLERGESGSLFAYVIGAHSWKKFLQPSVRRLWRAERDGPGFKVVPGEDQIPKYAFIGVRSCELNAIAIHDKVFNTDKYSDPLYNGMRKKVFMVAVNCTHPGGTCFCASLGTGPKAESGFDVALTEVMDGKRHYFLAEVGSQRGAKILQEVPHRKPGDEERIAENNLMEKAATHMKLSLETSHLRAVFDEHFEDPRWEDVAKRCLTCGNCTMVCPTCFCCSVEDANALDGAYAERWRKWDSCFSKDFSYIHGGSIRFSEHARYRQWLTHKLITWVDQFGTLGCVGCGRCITWCPVGIDITEEARSMLEREGNKSA